MGVRSRIARAAINSGFWRDAANDSDVGQLDIDLSEAPAVASPKRPSVVRWLPGLLVLAFVFAVVALLGAFSTTPFQ